MSFQEFNSFGPFKIIVLVILFIKCNFLFGQKEFSDTTEAYEYWSKRGVIEVIYAYMNDYVATVTDSSLPIDKKKDCKLEKIGITAYEKEFIIPLVKFGIDDLSTKLNEMSSFLPVNNWQGAEKNVLQPLMANLNSKKPLNNEFFVTLKPTGNEESTRIPGYNNTMVLWNKKVHEIISQYEIDLQKLSGKTSIKPIDLSNNKGLNVSVNPNGSEIKSINWGHIIISFCFAFVFGFIAALLIVKNKISIILKENKELLKKSQVSRENINAVKNKNIDNKNERFKKFGSGAITNSESNNQQNVIEIEDVKTTIDSSSNKKEPEKIELFFSIPENDGSFITIKSDSVNDGTKYYKIEYQKNSDTGNLFYINSVQDKRAINRLDSYLKPVCDIDNINNADNSNRIEMLKPGKIIKVAEKWVIDKNNKVKIKLL